MEDLFLWNMGSAHRLTNGCFLFSRQAKCATFFENKYYLHWERDQVEAIHKATLERAEIFKRLEKQVLV